MTMMLMAGFPGNVIRARLNLSRESWWQYSSIIRSALKEYDVLNNRPAQAGDNEYGGR